MRKPFLYIGAMSIVLCLSNQLNAQTCAPLWIPDTLSGTEFNLAIRDTFSQLRPGNQTTTLLREGLTRKALSKSRSGGFCEDL